jgi:hypothetical protein
MTNGYPWAGKQVDSMKPTDYFYFVISSNNCQFGSKFWIRPDEADAFFVNTHPKCSPEDENETLNP